MRDGAGLPPRLPHALGVAAGGQGAAAATGRARDGRRPQLVGHRPRRRRCRLDVRRPRLRGVGHALPARLRLRPGAPGPGGDQLPHQRRRQPQRRLPGTAGHGRLPGRAHGSRPAHRLRHGHPRRRGQRLRGDHHGAGPGPAPSAGAGPCGHARPHRLRLRGAAAGLRAQRPGGRGSSAVGQVHPRAGRRRRLLPLRGVLQHRPVLVRERRLLRAGRGRRLRGRALGRGGPADPHRRSHPGEHPRRQPVRGRHAGRRPPARGRAAAARPGRGPPGAGGPGGAGDARRLLLQQPGHPAAHRIDSPRAESTTARVDSGSPAKPQGLAPARCSSRAAGRIR